MTTAKSAQQPIDRIFAVFDALIAARRPMSLTEIATAAGLPPPTAHRLVGNLEDRGLLKRALGSRKQVLLGPRLVQLGHRVLDAALTADLPRGILEQLALQIKELCQIGTVVNGEVLYLDTVRARRVSGLQLEQGHTAPLHCTSMGKLYLATLDDAALKEWIQGAALEKFTPSTRVKPSELLNHIKHVRKNGYAFSHEEYGPGVAGCAVRIPLAAPRPFYAIGMSAPVARVPVDTLPGFLPMLRVAAQRIVAAMKLPAQE
jgi:DNA-binding IclR family transcriptional regulator